MFSNKLIRSMAVSSDENALRLSRADWQVVLEANKNFKEDPMDWKGDSLWGRYLLKKLTGYAGMDFRNSLELCCGNGYLYFSLKDLVEFDNRCVHIDLSEAQLNAFSLRCANSGGGAPNIICGDIGKLPFESGRFDIVYGNSFLHHLPDVGLYLTEAARVLAKGGKFIAFHEPTHTAPFWETFPRALFKRYDAESLTDIWLLRPEVIQAIMAEAGFAEVDVLPGGLFYSLFVTPWQMVMAKMGLNYRGRLFLRARIWMNAADRLLPHAFRLRYSPSICVVAVR